MTVSSFTVDNACRWCSGPWQYIVHVGPCPRVKSVEYHPDGSVKRVEFHAHNDGPGAATME